MLASHSKYFKPFADQTKSLAGPLGGIFALGFWVSRFHVLDLSLSCLSELNQPLQCLSRLLRKTFPLTPSLYSHVT